LFSGFNPEDGGRKVLRNYGFQLPNPQGATLQKDYDLNFYHRENLNYIPRTSMGG